MSVYDRGSGNFGFAIIHINGMRTNHWFTKKLHRNAKKAIAIKECKNDMQVKKIIDCERNLKLK